MINMKVDEKDLFRLCILGTSPKCKKKFTIRELIVISRLNRKRCQYLLSKWTDLGFYNYGVNLELGWFEMNKIPERYLAVLGESLINMLYKQEKTMNGAN